MTENLDPQYLAQIKSITDEVFGLESQIIEPSEFTSISTLICLLPKGQVMLDRTMSLIFLPFNDKEMQEIKLLQFFSILPGTTMTTVSEELKDALLHINHRTAIGNFSLHDGSEIAFRYVLPIAKNANIDKAIFAESMALYLLTLDLFSVKMRDFLNGTLSLESILKEI